MTQDYKSDLETAREELADLFRRREQLEVRIAKQQRKVAALASLSDESEETDQLFELGLSGLTNAVRAVFRATNTPLLAINVRDRLKELGFPVDEYQNILAAVHTTLRRLHAQGELEEHFFQGPGGSGPIGYKRRVVPLTSLSRGMRK